MRCFVLLLGCLAFPACNAIVGVPDDAIEGRGGEGGSGGEGGRGGAVCEPAQQALLAHYSADVVQLAGEDEVASWTDQRGSNHLQPSGDFPTRPKRVAGPNGRPAVRFSGISGLKAPTGEPALTLFDGGDQNPEATLVAVVRPNPTTEERTVVAFGEDSANFPRVWLGTFGGEFWTFEVTRGHQNQCEICQRMFSVGCGDTCDQQLGPELFRATWGAVSDDWAILVGSKGADTASIAWNGSVRTTTTSVPAIPWTHTQLWVGGLVAQAHYEGDIAEILVYGRELSDDEADQVAGCLGEKYGIALNP